VGDLGGYNTLLTVFFKLRKKRKLKIKIILILIKNNFYNEKKVF